MEPAEVIKLLAGILAALKTIAVGERHYGQHKGAVLFAQGMEYHYQNYLLNYQGRGYEWQHEVVAYLNRAGQMYYYLISAHVGAKTKDIPSLLGASRFRMKHTAHRQIDAPRAGDYLADFSAPGITTIMPIRRFQAFEHRGRENYFPGLTIPFGSDTAEGAGDTRSFFLHHEHAYIMADVLRVLSLLATKHSQK